MSELDSERLLRLLLAEDLPFVIVGGVAAIAHGGTMFTRDLDVAMPLDQETIPRLVKALAPVRPRHATRLDLGVIDNPGRLHGFRLLLLETDAGRLDVLGELPPFDDVASLPRTLRSVGGSLLVPVLSLDALIEVKAHVGRAKDRLMEQELRAIRDALRERGTE